MSVLQIVLASVIAGISAFVLWIVLPYILLAILALLCAAAGAAIGLSASGWIMGKLPSEGMPTIDLREQFTSLRARFTTTKEAA